MDATYKSYLQSFSVWIHDMEIALQQGRRLIITNDATNGTRQLIGAIAEYIEADYPFFANELAIISDGLFVDRNGEITLNLTAFGALVLIERQLSSEPINMQFWSHIHPRIRNISFSLYADGHFASAAEKAVKEVEDRLRELFRELKPNSVEPSRVGDIIGALLSENGAYHFTDTTTVSGKDYRRGIQSIFEGALTAYRNPEAHKNLPRSQRESLEEIVLASQLMYVLDIGSV